MAEFTIFPAFRRKHFALDIVTMILDRHPGKWEIKYNEKNGGAKKLWNTVVAPYKPEVHHLNEEETVLLFTTINDDEGYFYFGGNAFRREKNDHTDRNEDGYPGVLF